MKLNNTLITGASGNIGKSIAYKLAEQGHNLCLQYFSNEASMNELVAQLKLFPVKAITVKADISDPEQVADIFSQCDIKIGEITGVVNNAGIDGGRHSVYELSNKTLHDTFNVNFYGAINCIREAIQRMKPMNQGVIVNITSQAALFGGNQLSHYAASKAALTSYTTGVARELIQSGIRINCVSPGPVASDNSVSEHPVDSSHLPIGRFAESNEIADVVAWLLSDTASYVSGITIPVTAGR